MWVYSQQTKKMSCQSHGTSIDPRLPEIVYLYNVQSVKPSHNNCPVPVGIYRLAVDNKNITLEPLHGGFSYYVSRGSFNGLSSVRSLVLDDNVYDDLLTTTNDRIVKVTSGLTDLQKYHRYFVSNELNFRSWDSHCFVLKFGKPVLDIEDLVITRSVPFADIMKGNLYNFLKNHLKTVGRFSSFDPNEFTYTQLRQKMQWHRNISNLRTLDDDAFLEKVCWSLNARFVVKTPSVSRMIQNDLMQASAEMEAEEARQNEAVKVMNREDRERIAAHQAKADAQKTVQTSAAPVGNTAVPAAGIALLKNNINMVSKPGKDQAKKALKKLDEGKSLTPNEKRNISEGLGEIGGRKAQERLGIQEDSRFKNRYHGSDSIGYDSDGDMVETEFKGTAGNSTAISTRKGNKPQLSVETNEERSKNFVERKVKKIGKASG